MHDRNFRVKLIGSKNSFLFFSENDSRLLDHEHMIRLSYGINKTAFFSLGASLSSIKEGELAMCSVLAKELGIIKNDIVNLSSTPYIASIRRLRLLTSNEDDYEMLGVLAETVQSTLLHQVKIVHNQQKLVIWIKNSLHVTVIVDSVEPISPGKLEMLTEVEIVPPLNEIEPNNYTYQHNSEFTSTLQKENIMNLYHKTQCSFRLLPVECLTEGLTSPTIAHDKKIIFEQPFNAFLSKRNFALIEGSYRKEEAFNSGSVTLVTLRIISPPSDIKEMLYEQHEVVDNVIVRLFCFDDDDVAADPLKAEVLYVHQMMFEHFHASSNAKVLVESLKQKSAPFVPKSIDIVTESKYFNKVDELVRNYLCRYCQDGNKVLLHSGLVMEEATEGCRFVLKFDPPRERFLLVDSRIMRECKFKLADAELIQPGKPPGNGKERDKPSDLCLDCCNYQEIVTGICDCLLKFDSNAILTGSIGSGKTVLIKKIEDVLTTLPNFIHVEYVACSKLKGKNIESLLKVLESIFLRLIYYQPSILILDDLHVICEKVIEGDQPTQENLQFNKVSEMLSGEIENIVKQNRVSVLATSQSIGKLNENIYNSRGKHVFKNYFSVNEMNREDRIIVLKYLFQKKGIKCDTIDFYQLGIKTEGFIMQDLLDLVNKIIFEVYKEKSNEVVDDNELVIATKHCEMALKNSSSLSLRQVQLHSPGERDFSDIGGLDDIKKILVETMLWPAQYSNIFAESPLRLQSGVLLYGPPGTGKTILAGAAAKQCNLRLISVKGPELLSKYIGASEQAVRDIFQKAQSAKPCILFFDEFDSLAPRRGHDNTGVTDRVVNQFLTQLDGVESLNGVCVLAATSRPDLLDPALLRPGRLDRQILCPLPDKISRIAIFKSLSKKLNLANDIIPAQVVDSLEGFSGADLQAVLYTAQLNSVTHLLQDANIKVDHSGSQTITQKHLNDAVNSTRPSLTREEKAKYERIYQKFQGKADIVEALKSGKQKSTLA